MSFLVLFLTAGLATANDDPATAAAPPPDTVATPAVTTPGASTTSFTGTTPVPPPPTWSTDPVTQSTSTEHLTAPPTSPRIPHDKCFQPDYKPVAGQLYTIDQMIHDDDTWCKCLDQGEYTAWYWAQGMAAFGQDFMCKRCTHDKCEYTAWYWAQGMAAFG